MIDELVVYSDRTIRPLLGNRTGENVLGRAMTFVSSNENLARDLAAVESEYVLFGIKEDIGVRANFGRPGTANAWDAVLKRLVNVQINPLNPLGRPLLLGHLEFPDLMERVSDAEDPSDLHLMVEKIDAAVTAVVETIVAAGKIPIAVGGGHNNAYGMLKGTSRALGHPVNTVNIDAHADMRPRDYRHSGNGFSYALHEDLLDRYFVFGLHENYISEAIYDEMERYAPRVGFNTYESMRVRGERDFEREAQRVIDFMGAERFGLEIDVDAMAFIPSSAYTPSGFSVGDVRRLIHLWVHDRQPRYVHICEGAIPNGNPQDAIAVSKTVIYLLTDIIRGR